MFTTRCFIRKDTKELREYLKNIGYKICCCCDFEESCWLSTYGDIVHGVGFISPEESVDTQSKSLSLFLDGNKDVDCGTNDELFKSITALRDDSLFMQWFIYDKSTYLNDKNKWVMCYHSGNKRMYELLDKKIIHKATVEELIEHFK